MPAMRKRPPMEMEPGEGKKHEMGESPDDEVREGSDDMPKGKHSRKRGARGAKKTKAPMDGEGCACGAGKGKKCTCDGGCGSYKKMDSALTPHEYLAACDMGIQDRSRQYIRSRLDAAERLDLKCGNGSISQGEKCTKGTAQKVDPNAKYSIKGRAVSEAKRGATQGALMGAAGGYIAGALTGGGLRAGLGQAALGAAAGAAYGALGGASRGATSAALNRAGRAYTRNRQNIKNANAEIKNKWEGKWKDERNAAYQSKDRNRIAAVENKQAGEMDRILNRNSTQIWTNANKSWASVDRERRRTKRDSVYAAGFTPEYDQLAV